MGLNLIDRIQAKIELFRLEQRYTRRRHRRSTFVSNAIYVDGEYIYQRQSPNTTGSSSATASSSAASPPTTTTNASQYVDTAAQKGVNRRWSAMPGFGHRAEPPVVGSLPAVGGTGAGWRKKRVSFHV